MRRELHCLHVWLVGTLLTLWTASGLRMVALRTDVSAAAQMTGEPM